MNKKPYTFCDLIGDVNDLACEAGDLASKSGCDERLYALQSHCEDLVFKLIYYMRLKGGEMNDQI